MLLDLFTEILNRGVLSLMGSDSSKKVDDEVSQSYVSSSESCDLTINYEATMQVPMSSLPDMTSLSVEEHRGSVAPSSTFKSDIGKARDVQFVLWESPEKVEGGTGADGEDDNLELSSCFQISKCTSESRSPKFVLGNGAPSLY